MSRDLRGYGGKWPDVRWPGGARVAVSIVVNFEEGGELTVSGGDARNEAVYEVVDEKRGMRDLAIESHFDYGTRAGGGMQVTVADIDGDGRADIGVGGKSGLFLFKNLGVKK